MAQTVADLIVKISVQFKDATKGIKNFSKDIGGLKGKFSKLSTGAKVAWAAVGAIVIKTLKESADASIAFEKDLTHLGNITNQTVQQLSGVGREIQKLGSKFGVSSNEIAHGLTEMAKLGYSTADSLKALPQILRFNVATGSKFKDTIGLIETTLKDFKKELKDVDIVTDIFTSTLKRGRLTTQGLADAFSKAGLPASRANASISDLAAAISIMAQKGIQANTAGVALNTIFGRLVKTGGPAQKALKDIGVNAFTASGELKPFGALIDEIREKTKNLTGAQKLQFETLIAGGPHQSRFGALLADTSGKFTDLSKSLESNTGATKAWFENIDKTTAQSFAKLDETFENFKRKTGKALEPALKASSDIIITFLEDINEGLDRNAKKTEEGLNAWQIFWSNLDELTIQYAEQVKGELNAFVNWINNLFSGLWKKLTEGVISGWTSIKTAIVDQWNQIMNFLTSKLSDAFNWGRNLATSIGKGIRGGISYITSSVKSIGSRIKSFLGFASPTDMGPLSTSDKWMPNFINMLTTGLESGIPKIQMAVGDVASSIAVIGNEEAGSNMTVNVYPRQSNLDAGGLTRELQRVAWLNGGVI